MSLELKPRSDRKHDMSLIAFIIVGLAGVVMLSRLLDSRRPPANQILQEENLYLNGNTAKRLSLGFNGMVADWYWMRSLQYVGRKVLSSSQDSMLDSLGDLNLSLLAPLLDTATTLDPAFIEPYEYAAIVLPAVDVDAAIRLTKKGIAANPSSWKLYHHLGYIYWQRGDYAAAAQTYGAGAEIPGAPAWMKAMKAKMSADGGSRGTAREIYSRMFEDSVDTKVKDMAALRLKQLDSLDERDLIRKVLLSYQSKRNQCPSSWPELAAALQALRFSLDNRGSPLDPAGFPYHLTKQGCDVELDPASPIPTN
jgi:tetratricopeptide (TPR) repeat protein